MSTFDLKKKQTTYRSRHCTPARRELRRKSKNAASLHLLPFRTIMRRHTFSVQLFVEIDSAGRTCASDRKQRINTGSYHLLRLNKALVNSMISNNACTYDAKNYD